MKRFSWIFNHEMMWGAVLGFLIFGAIGTIREAWQHRGSGYIQYDEDVVKVPESEYKRHEYESGVFMLALGVWIWIIAAREYSPGRTDSGRPSADIDEGEP